MHRKVSGNVWSSLKRIAFLYTRNIFRKWNLKEMPFIMAAKYETFRKKFNKTYKIYTLKAIKSCWGS